MTSETAPQRRPLTGSCHCGYTQYILFLTLPHTLPPSSASASSFPQQSIYRCNCTLCHKMGHFHVHAPSPAHDFFLLSPSTPADLGDYTGHGRNNLHFYFCPRCGVRCFIASPDGEVGDVNLEDIDLPEKRTGTVKAWRPRLGGGGGGGGGGGAERMGYLSVNGHTIDAEQGFDMRDLTEKEVVEYCDCYSPEGKQEADRYGKPHAHGCY